MDNILVLMIKHEPESLKPVAWYLSCLSASPIFHSLSKISIKSLIPGKYEL